MKKTIIVIFLLLTCFLIGQIIGGHYMICRYWSIEKNDWKTVKCWKSEDMSKEIVPTYTSTEYVPPIDTFTPEPTETPEPTNTIEPYPPIATDIPIPYPMSAEEVNWWKLYFWKR